MKRICVTGGGAAGMAAALFAARGGANVTLLERNEKLGKKVYITGKGRCNFTNVADGQEFLANVPHNPRFLYSALSFLPNQRLVELIEELGVPTKLERGGRYFPASDKASDVTRAFERELRRLGVAIMLDTAVDGLERDAASGAWRVEAGGLRREFDSVIVCTGGASYPSTGSDGRFNSVLARLGLKTVPLRPGLVPIVTREKWPGRLSGVSLKNVELRLGAGKKAAFREQGEMLFTHFGISGPLALSLSSYLPDDAPGQIAYIDLKPALDEETLLARLKREREALGRRQTLALLEQLMPRALAREVADIARLDAEAPVNRLNEPQLRELARLLKAIPLTIEGTRGFEEAIITRGGIDVKEIDPRTLMCKKLPQLFIAGEALDVDALTGGFNLRIAFSTGALAGHSAAQTAE